MINLTNINLKTKKDGFYIKTNIERKLITIGGNCYSPKSINFFNLVYEWIDHYFYSHDLLRLICKINGMNTCTIICVLELFYRLDSYIEKGKTVHITWYYEDKPIKEIGGVILKNLDVDYKIIEQI